MTNPQAEFFEPILAACAPIAALDVALDAELAVSALLGGAYAAADEDRDAAVGRFAGDLVSVLSAGRTDALTGALLAGLAGVAPGDAAGRAADALVALADRGGLRPTWADSVGEVRCTGSWAMSDVFGDQTEYILSFEYVEEKLGGAPHAVCVLVDFNLGVVKDCWTALDPDAVLADCRRSAATDDDLLLAEVSPGTVRSTVTELFAATDALAQLPAAQGLSEERCVVLSRLFTLPETAGADTSAAAADALVAEFRAASEGAVEGVDGEVVEACARLIVEYSIAGNRIDPLRWSPTTVETFLTDWAPRSAVIDEESVRALPAVLAAFVTWAGHRSGRPERAVQATQEAVTAYIVTFAEAMFGSDTEQTTAAQLARQLIAEGVDPTDDTAVRAWLDARMRPSS